MSLLTVCQDVCAVVGVMRPASIFSGLMTSRTQQELLALANEMAQRIAADHREWTALYRVGTFTGDGFTNVFQVPVNFRRLLLTSNVYRSSFPQLPMTFLPNPDDVLQRQLTGYWYTASPGYFWIAADGFRFHPVLAGPPPIDPFWANATTYAVNARVRDPDLGTYWKAVVAHISAATGTFASDRLNNPSYWGTTTPLAPTGPPETAKFIYLGKDCIVWNGASGGTVSGPEFQADDDVFYPDERVLKLGMIWQWKAQKGTPYAEDLGTYEDALDRLAGSDKPAPIIIGTKVISARANVAMPWPADWGSVTR